jgi:hypothetical protein
MVPHDVVDGYVEFLEVPQRSLKVRLVECSARVSKVVLTEIAELRDERDVAVSINGLGEIEDHRFRQVAQDSSGAFVEAAWADVAVSYDGEFHGISVIQSASEQHEIGS